VRRAIIDAIFYLVDNGVKLRPRQRTSTLADVYGFLTRWSDDLSTIPSPGSADAAAVTDGGRRRCGFDAGSEAVCPRATTSTLEDL
jgi:hypothetical protein